MTLHPLRAIGAFIVAFCVAQQWFYEIEKESTALTVFAGLAFGIGAALLAI